LQELCQKHNVLLICDEIQTGLARTGKLLASHYEDVKADVLILGKALSGGFYPVSAVLASKEVMLCIRPGEHGSTFGGNPLACAVAMEAIQVILDEGLVDNAFEMGNLFRERLISFGIPLIAEVRGKGLLNAIELDVQKLKAKGKSAFEFCTLMMHNGLLAKPTRENVIRLAPPLCITRQEIETACEIIRRSLTD
jgi:ornithine--oxo-acid transaminase